MKTPHTYRPEIDGLRAVAVLAVILNHAGVPGFGGGYVGVDVFFVISGYLITSLIVKDLEAGTFSLAQFYERRVRRILPALVVVTAVAAAVAWLVLLPLDARDAYQSVAAAMGMASNVLFWKESGYFNTEAELKPLLHTWSLAVEEQFYLLYPLGLAALWRLGDGRARRRLASTLASIGFASFIAAQWAALEHPDAAFFLLPMRAWELLVGAVTACFVPLHRPNTTPIAAAVHPSLAVLLSVFLPGRWRQAGALVGLALIVASILGYDEANSAAAWLTAPVFGAALVIGCAGEGTWVGRVLRSAPMRAIGRISYSAYLIHHPLFAFVRYPRLGGPEWPVMVGLAALTLMCAWLSWRFVERPFRESMRVGRRAALAAATAAVSVVGLIGVAGAATSGFEFAFRTTLSDRAVQAYERYIETAESVDAATPDGECRFNMERVLPRNVKTFEACAARHGKALIVLGDSHAWMAYLGMLANSDRPFIAGAIMPACQLSRSRFHVCQYDRFAEFVKTHADQIERIVYVQSGAWLLDFPKNPAPTERAIDYLNQLPPGIPIVMTGPQIEPQLRVAPMAKAMLRCDLSAAAEALIEKKKYEDLDAALKRRFAAQERIRYLSLIDALHFDARVDLYDCDAVYWRDRGHWSGAGQLRFGERLLAAHPELVASHGD